MSRISADERAIIDSPICIANRQDQREPGRFRNNHESRELHEYCSDPHSYSWHSFNSWFKLWFRRAAGLRPSASTADRRFAVANNCLVPPHLL
jgi:hypothetical protein